MVTVHRLLRRVAANGDDSSGFVIVAAIVIFVDTYVLVATAWMRRVMAALGGTALIFLLSATTRDEAFLNAEAGVDSNVTLLLFGMMVMVSVVKKTGRSSTSPPAASLAQISSTVEMVAMTTRAMARAKGWVASLTMTFMPRMEDTAVTGRVTAAITASRSAAMVILVLVRAW